MKKQFTQRGASMTELLIALPMFVLMIFIIAEMSLMHQAKSVLDVASLAAARAGAINGGNPTNMRNAAAAAMAPLHAPGQSTTEAIGESILKNILPYAVGSTSVTNTLIGPNVNSLGGGSQQGIEVKILSPTSQMMKDFGVTRKHGGVTSKVIPNDNLMYRDAKVIGNVNVQDANLLKIRVTYLYETKMPLTRYFFTPLMNANLTGTLFGGQSAGSTANVLGGWRVPLVSYATVRMQSDFREGSLSAAIPGSTGTGWTDPASPGTPVHGFGPGGPGAPGNTITGEYDGNVDEEGNPVDLEDDPEPDGGPIDDDDDDGNPEPPGDGVACACPPCSEEEAAATP